MEAEGPSWALRRGTLGLLLLFLASAGAELEVSVVSPVTAAVGSDALLDCTYAVQSSSVDLRHLGILWHFNEQYLLTYAGGNLTAYDPRASINESAIPNGKASMLLSNVTISDEGSYTCSITYTPQNKQKTVTLNIQARPKIIVPEQEMIMGKENLLRCFVIGFYPVEIDVFWQREGQVLPGSSMSKAQRNADGTFTINSTLPITPTASDTSANFSCCVNHPSLPRFIQKDAPLLFKVVEEKGVSAAAIVVPLLLIVALVAALGWFLYRRLTRREPILSEIQGPKTWTVGETVELFCVGHHDPKDTKIIWIKLHKGKETEIEAKTSPTQDDRQPLLSMNRYRAESRKASEGGRHATLTSTLCITPSLEEDEGAVFKCRFFTIDHKIKEEKEFKGFELYGKPQVNGNITCFPCDGINVQCALDLTQFYPKEIQVKWSCGSGKLEDVSSKERETENADERTFNIRTECSVPEEAFNDVNFKIRVTWEHTSLKAPEYREMSVTDPDFPGRPRLDDILVPRLSHGFEAPLQCRVFEYFPKKLHVQWLKVEKTSDGRFLQYECGNEDVPKSNGGLVPVCPSGGIYPTVTECSGSAAPPPLSIESGGAPQTNKSKRLGPQADRSDGHLRQSDGKDESVNQIHRGEGHIPQSNGPVAISNGIDWVVPPSEGNYVPSYKHDVTDIPVPVSDESDDDVPRSNESEQLVPQSEGRVGLGRRSNGSDGPPPQCNGSYGRVNQINTRDGPAPHSDRGHGRVLPSDGPETIPTGPDGSVPQYNASDGAVLPSVGSFKPALLSDVRGVPVSSSAACVSLCLQSNDLSCCKSDHTNPTHEPGKGYCYTARVVFIPDLHRDQGSAFICRVSHPSLKEALEKRTGKLSVLSEPRVSGFKIESFKSGGIRLPFTPLQDDSTTIRTLLLDVWGFYPGKVAILWAWDSPGAPSALPSALNMTEEEDGTYSAQSTCHLSRKEREKAGESPPMITVTIEHEARREPLKGTIRLKKKGHQFNVMSKNFLWAPKTLSPPPTPHL